MIVHWFTSSVSTWKQQAQNMGRTCCVQKMFWMSKQNQKTIFVHNMFSPCYELVVFMYWTGKSMNNVLSYCGLVDVGINASDKDLPVKDSILDFAGNASSASTSGQLSETTFTVENHQITGYLFSDHNVASKHLNQISTEQK